MKPFEIRRHIDISRQQQLCVALALRIVAQTGGAAAAKDIAQAEQLLTVLVEDRPGDIVLAWTDLEPRGRRWVRCAKQGASRLSKSLRESLTDYVPDLVSTE